MYGVNGYTCTYALASDPVALGLIALIAIVRALGSSRSGKRSLLASSGFLSLSLFCFFSLVDL
jgi:hypothetical protein